MPQIGEIRRAKDTHPDRHYSYAAGLNKYIWAACLDCSKERWVPLKKGKPFNLRCQQCGCGSTKASGAGNNWWKGGIQTTQGGYILLWTSPNDFFFSMANKRGYILEHRLVMAKHLKRNLHRWELVHHKGIAYPIGSIENKQDNRIDNLMIIVTGNKGNGRHTAKIKCPYCSNEFRVT